MAKLAIKLWMAIRIGLLVIGAAGCLGQVAALPEPIPDLKQTQTVLSGQVLLEQKRQTAPTLTALSPSDLLARTPLANPSATSSPVPTDPSATASLTGLPEPTQLKTSTPGFSQRATQDGLQATINAALPTFFATTSVQPPPEWTSQSPTQSSPVPLVRDGRLAIPSPTPFIPAVSLLYSDDFSEKRGWFVTDSGRYFLGYGDDTYRIYVKNASNPVWSVRSATYDDVRLEVDVVQQAGPVDGYFGLVCRLVDSDNYYLLAASFNGDFVIARVQDKKLNYLNFANLASPRLRLLGNRLRADCIDENLALYVDGVKVIETKDSEFGSGYAGLVAGDRSISGTDVLFDNFVVIKP